MGFAMDEIAGTGKTPPPYIKARKNITNFTRRNIICYRQKYP